MEPSRRLLVGELFPQARGSSFDDLKYWFKILVLDPLGDTSREVVLGTSAGLLKIGSNGL